MELFIVFKNHVVQDSFSNYLYFFKIYINKKNIKIRIILFRLQRS